MERKQNHTDIYCGNDCDNPPTLEYAQQIDLKDGVNLLLDKNPSKIITNEEYHHYFKLCNFADHNLFPVLGGYYEQPTTFIEFFDEYIRWKDAQKQLDQRKLIGNNNG